MKLKLKGSTILEVLIALVITSTILILFINILVYIVRTFNNTKKITSDSFSAVKVLEEQVEEVRTLVADKLDPLSSISGFVRKNFIVFNADRSIYESNIPVYEVLGKVGNSNYMTYVNDLKKLKLPTVDLESAESIMTITKPTAVDVKEGYYGYYDSDASFKAEATYKDSDKDLFYKNLFDWYVSDYGFNVPYQNKSLWGFKDESDVEGIFPSFPKNYEIINHSEEVFKGDKYTDSFKGRNVLANITAVGKNGKRGEPLETDPILILSLPINSSLVMAYDASLILHDEDVGLSNAVYSPILGKAYVKKAPNIAVSTGAVTSLDLHPNSGGQGVGLDLAVTGSMKSAFEDVYIHPTTQYLKFDGSDFMISASNSDVDKIEKISIFVVAKVNGDTAATLISRGGSTDGKWELGLNGFTIYDSGGEIKKVSAKAGEGIEDDNKWHVVSATSKMDFYIDGKKLGNGDKASVMTGEGLIKVGGNINNKSSKVDIAEILVFNQELNNPGLKIVNEYLKLKYGLSSK